MVLKNRKVFQAPNTLVDLGESKTNGHSCKVYLNDTLLCIASNSWASTVEDQPAASRAWIQANQVHFKVSRPLWVEKTASSSHRP